MSEPTIEAPATGAPTEQPPAEPNPAETVEFWKQKSREQETRAKANADAARRLQEIEDAQKSEQQRTLERQAAIERERDEARADGLRYKTAAEHGIDKDYYDLLGSGDEETIGARAARIGELLNAQKELTQVKAELEALKSGKPAPTERPVESMRPGATPSDTPTEDDVLYNTLYGR